MGKCVRECEIMEISDELGFSSPAKLLCCILSFLLLAVVPSRRRLERLKWYKEYAYYEA